jgi:acetate---CoA ligase (ADP-forming)
MVNLRRFFQPRKIAIIGASRNPNKVGHVIMKNVIDGRFIGEIVPVNPKADYILNRKVYPSILKVKDEIDLAIISVPSKFVLKTVEECNRKKIKDVLIVTAGFSEIGKVELEKKLRVYLDKNKMRCIGVNCLGVYDSHNNLDTLFLPRYRLRRPEPGPIAFVCQSGAVGSAVMDKATEEGHKFSKFISYGNATNIDESDIIDFLGNDEKTKVICLYVEGVDDGDKFFETVRRVSKNKPIIALKGGLTEEGMKSTVSHTGTLAGKKEVYLGVFNQTGVIRADSLEEMFTIASLIEKEIKFKGNKLQVITNGGGYGIVSTDNISEAKNIDMADLTAATKKTLRKIFPDTINIENPLDLLGDATTERYRLAIEACSNDKNVDGIFLIALYQTPLLTTDIVEVISEAHKSTKKPIIVVSTGGEFTEILSESLEENGLPVFEYPKEAVIAIDKIIWWEKKRKTL